MTAKYPTIMAPGEIPQGVGEPFTWDDSVQVPLQAEQMWKEVANGIDKNQTGASIVVGLIRSLIRTAL